MSDTTNSSTEGEEIPLLNINDSRCLTLHVITDPGRSVSVNTSFQYIIGRLDPSLDVISVSERFKPHKTNESLVENKDNSETLNLPSLAVVLFFKEEFKLDKPFDKTASHHSDLYQIKKFLCQKPWRFHHKVEVSGKLISCESNQQDFYYFSYNNGNSQEDETESCTNNPMHFPLWAVRKVHYGRPILRFQLFVDAKNWKNQINFYKLILRKEESIVRDDFCYFISFENDGIVVQLALKKLPISIKPQPVLSSILQFKVKNVGQLVPLLPNSCEPISELRWRTRDHDSNLVLLQIRRTRDLNAGASFVRKLFTDQDSREFKETKRRVRRNKGKAGLAKPKPSALKTKQQSPDLSQVFHSTEDFEVGNSQPPEAMLVETSENNGTIKTTQVEMDISSPPEPEPRISSKSVNFDLDNIQHKEADITENKESADFKQLLSIIEPKRGRSFELEKKEIGENPTSLPLKFTKDEPTVYFQTNHSRHSPRSSSGSSRSTTGTSDYHTTRETSPESHSSDTKIKIKTTKKERIIYMTKKCSSFVSPTESAAKDRELTSSPTSKSLPLTLSKDEGFYV